MAGVTALVDMVMGEVMEEMMAGVTVLVGMVGAEVTVMVGMMVETTGATTGEEVGGEVDMKAKTTAPPYLQRLFAHTSPPVSKTSCGSALGKR